jgi:hypothetical protein
MIENGINFWEYNRDGSLDYERTQESFIGYLEVLSKEDLAPAYNDDEMLPVYVVLTTPSSKHWYEKPIAAAQGSQYSHTGITFDKRMSTLYHVRSSGLIVSRRKDFERERLAFDLYEYNIPSESKRRLKNLITKMTRMETKYDFLMVGRLLGKIIFRLKDNEAEKMNEKEVIEKQKYICSGWVAGILAATVSKFRKYLFRAKKKWSGFMPQDFVKVDGLVMKRRIVFPENRIAFDSDKSK